MNSARPVARRLVLGPAFLSVLAQASAAGLGAQESKGVHVCVGTDNVIRFNAGDKCPGGQRMYRLAEVEDEVGIAKERDEPTSAVVADLKAKIDLLSKRVGNLEMEALKAGNDPKLPTQVTAPFEVVDKSGNTIFAVSDAPHASVARKGRVQIARTVGGGFSMLVRGATGKNVLGLGDAGDGGMLYVGDQAGVTRILGSAESGLKLYNKSDAAVAHLLASPAGNGQFWLYDAGGRPMVNAGTDGAVGVVQTGPNIKCVPQAGLRVGDCLRGRP